MSRIVVDISMSLDGFVTGPNAGVGNPLGDDQGRLHDWMFDQQTEADRAVLDGVYETGGALVMGRRMFDVGYEPWGDPPPFGMPVFVVTHRPQVPLPMGGGTTYTFALSLDAALDTAREAANGKNVGVWGGAGVIQQCLAQRVVDEFQIHLVPVLLGDGVRLFGREDTQPVRLAPTRTIATPSAIHLQFGLANENPFGG
jgi:dihydrofolate reductase